MTSVTLAAIAYLLIGIGLARVLARHLVKYEDDVTVLTVLLWPVAVFVMVVVAGFTLFAFVVLWCVRGRSIPHGARTPFSHGKT